jgi:hypothetical protein
MNWLVHILGIDNEAGRWYAFWSGAGSDIGEVAILGGMVAFWRRHSCHVDSPRFCWRPGTHQVVGTPYRTCKKHHPAVPERVTADHIASAHADAQTPQI